MSWTKGVLVNRERIGDIPAWLGEVKAHLRIDSDETEHDTLLVLLLSSAISDIENYCGISILETRVEMSWTELNGRNELPYGPIRSVDEVPEGYTVRGYQNGFQLIESNTTGAGEITYTAGFVNIPDEIKLGAMKHVTDNFEQRSGVDLTGIKTVQIMPNNWKKIVAGYNRKRWL